MALYIGAASGDDRNFGSALSALLKGAGVRKVVWPKLSKRKKDASVARAALHEADLVFVGGGDVEAGIDALREADLVDDLHGAAKRGVVFAGMSAGAIMLGERWIRWPRAGAGDDEAETYECLGAGAVLARYPRRGRRLAGDAVLRRGSRARARQEGARVRRAERRRARDPGTDGSLRARGDAVTVFAALPNRKAKIEKQLEADE